jgi:hypothetical protein
VIQYLLCCTSVPNLLNPCCCETRTGLPCLCCSNGQDNAPESSCNCSFNLNYPSMTQPNSSSTYDHYRDVSALHIYLRGWYSRCTIFLGYTKVMDQSRISTPNRFSAFAEKVDVLCCSSDNRNVNDDVAVATQACCCAPAARTRGQFSFPSDPLRVLSNSATCCCVNIEAPMRELVTLIRFCECTTSSSCGGACCQQAVFRKRKSSFPREGESTPPQGNHQRKHKSYGTCGCGCIKPSTECGDCSQNLCVDFLLKDLDTPL